MYTKNSIDFLKNKYIIKIQNIKKNEYENKT